LTASNFISAITDYRKSVFTTGVQKLVSCLVATTIYPLHHSTFIITTPLHYYALLIRHTTYSRHNTQHTTHLHTTQHTTQHTTPLHYSALHHYTLHTTPLHTTHYTLHTTHYTLHTTHYTLHTTHYTLHTTHYMPLYHNSSPRYTRLAWDGRSEKLAAWRLGWFGHDVTARERVGESTILFIQGHSDDSDGIQTRAGVNATRCKTQLCR